jgi:hypothetical protein
MGDPTGFPFETNRKTRRWSSLQRPAFGLVLLSLFALREVCAQSPARHSSQKSFSTPTDLRVESPPWWPTKGSPDRKEYAGSAACAKCHAEKFASQALTSMARTATRASDSQLLKSHPELRFDLAPYKYEQSTTNGQSLLSVSNGVEATSRKLQWALGDGYFGQSYVYRDNGKYYEAQLSFYTAINGLDITTGHPRAIPQNLAAAAGERMPPDSVRQCFGCHLTASTTSGHFDPDQAVMGVTCEACHGPGVEHVVLMTSGVQDAKGSVMNPATLEPADSVDFCGACHRTSADAVLQGLFKTGVLNVRLQPYRLEKSKCWGGKGDTRLTCVACHDPHAQVTREAQFYDNKCLQCHAQGPTTRPTASHPGKACKVSSKDCVTCHMPKIEVPSIHSTFTDHRIRIARQGEPYPE